MAAGPGYEDSTRETYVGYIDRMIKSALSAMAIAKLSVRHLEILYAGLRRCRVWCDGNPYVAHRAKGEHDCVAAKYKPHVCKPHVCKPMAASAVRQIHAIISGALSAAVRWGLLDSDPVP